MNAISDFIGVAQSYMADLIFAVTEGVIYGVIPFGPALVIYLLTRNRFNNRAAANFVLAFSSFGIFIGVFTGGSREPIVDAMLPAIITSATAFLVYLFKSNADTVNREWIPLSILSMTLFSTFGSYFASEIRDVSLRNSAGSTQQISIMERIDAHTRQLEIMQIEKVQIPTDRYVYCIQKTADKTACEKLLTAAK
ncbi:hypothetical protein HGO38_01820 [Rhizobium sp. CG5]|uniref:hypothetical protein n=1 Tax=Rhizobium sp. CG5 TaxID=2726076 RepID=UPI002033DCDC|nr:hypothetical protein [Rhizobium sp. CG5]MCM2472213.1 hypothetical protein [Rhizobium sp. CG5]